MDAGRQEQIQSQGFMADIKKIIIKKKTFGASEKTSKRTSMAK